MAFDNRGVGGAGVRNQALLGRNKGREHPYFLRVLLYHQQSLLNETPALQIIELVDGRKGRIHGHFHDLGAVLGTALLRLPLLLLQRICCGDWMVLLEGGLGSGLRRP